MRMTGINDLCHDLALFLSWIGFIYLIASLFLLFSFLFNLDSQRSFKACWNRKRIRKRRCEPGHCAAMSFSATGRSSQSWGRRLSVGRPAAPRVTKSTYTYKHRSPRSGSPTTCPRKRQKEHKRNMYLCQMNLGK